ncbi:MAG: helix-turn-helix domain-containing protein, partial [Micrococcales bacterium]|nr:helix-turn-helix domain-containing protein [Micrococcales bacterium]
MTTLEAARHLNVSQRQVERLVAAGTLSPTRQVGRAFMIDAASVARLAEQDRQKGRPWHRSTAWAGLWRLSGLETPWLSRQASRRLDQRLVQISPDQLLWICRDRVQTKRFRASESFLTQLSAGLRLTGSSAAQPTRDLLSPPTDRVDGYVTSTECEAAVREFFLVEDPAGNVTLRMTGFP